MNPNYTYREITGLTTLLKVLLGLSVAMGAVGLLSSFMQAELFSQSSFTKAEGLANDTREGIIGLFALPLYLFTVVIFGRWIVRANRNARALGAFTLRFTPGWAVGYFFIPIVNLWRPYQAMKDLWQVSRNPTAWSSTTADFVLPAWWTLWLASGILAQISFRVLLVAQDIESLQVGTYFQIASEAMYIPLCLVAMSLVSQISHYQTSHVGEGT